MTKHHYHADDSERFDLYAADDQHEDEAGFERIRRSAERPTSVKLDRRQQDKEWGKQINKYHKQRRKVERNKKP